jgi:RNA polymerase sigma factor (sigma-70 family)
MVARMTADIRTNTNLVEVIHVHEKPDRLAVNHLTTRQWEALWLRLVEELTYREIGERMGISERAASRHVQRALHRIHEHANTKKAA